MVLFDEVIATAMETLTEAHWFTGAALANRGYCWIGLDEPDAAQQDLDAAIRILTETLGADHRRTRTAIEARDGDGGGWGKSDSPYKKVRVVTTVNFSLD